MTLEGYLDSLLADKQNYSQLRQQALTDLDNLLTSFETEKTTETAAQAEQLNILDQITALKQNLAGYKYQEEQLDMKIQETRNVLGGMTGA